MKTLITIEYASEMLEDAINDESGEVLDDIGDYLWDEVITAIKLELKSKDKKNYIVRLEAWDRE